MTGAGGRRRIGRALENRRSPVSHSHSHGAAVVVDPDDQFWSEVDVRRRARRSGWALIAILLPLLVVTVAGVVALWPAGRAPAARLDFAAGGVTFPRGTITSLTTSPCPVSDPGAVGAVPPTAPSRAQVCGTAAVTIADGPDAGRSVTMDVSPDVVEAGVGAGVILLKTPEQSGSAATFSIYDVQRGRPLVAMAILMVVVAVVVARLRGLLALVGLGFAGVVLVAFMLPALVAGEDPLLVGLTGSAAIMFVVLYLAHGVSRRTSTALLGTFAGLALIAGLGKTAVGLAHLTGISSEDNSLLAQVATTIDMRGLLTCGIVLAGLGVLNDVTITQASAVWELREAAPGMPPLKLYRTAMRIGRDHIASTIYTIVFAYAGAALPVLLLIVLYGQPLGNVLTSADIAEELVRSMASAIGLVLAVPLTTGLAVAVASTGGPAQAQARTRGRGSRRRGARLSRT